MKTKSSMCASRKLWRLILLCALLLAAKVDAFATSSRSVIVGLHKDPRRRFATPSSHDGEDLPISSVENRNKGILVLMTVPLAWGTFEPVIRYTYAIEPPIPGLVFSPCYYLVAASALSILSFLTSRKDQESEKGIDDDDLLSTGEAAETGQRSVDMQPILGGMELGFYLFLGNSLQVLGLKTLTADRVAFLIQLTTIFVPLVQGIAARNLFAIPVRTWIACVIALGGVTVIGLEGNEEALALPSGAVSGDLGALGSNLLHASSSGQLLSQGDLLVIGSALAYTFHCIRLEKYAKQTRAVTLASYKAITELVLSVLLVVGLCASYSGETGEGIAASSSTNFLVDFATEAGEEISLFLATFPSRLVDGSIPSTVLVPAAGAVLWTGLVTVAYTIYAQSYGQSRVSPSDANLIYTFQPVWTSLLAFFLLGETLGPTGFAGGALIGLAVLLVISAEQEPESSNTS